MEKNQATGIGMNVRAVLMLQMSAPASAPYRWWEEQELRDLTASMGLQNFQRHRQNRFIMFAVSKPHVNKEDLVD